MAEQKVLITGVCGLLGQNLVKVLRNDYDLIGADILPEPAYLPGLSGYVSLDISDPVAVKAALERFTPDIVINTAAITNVDACEKEQEKADLINHQAVQFLLNSIGKQARFVQISTDYVFDGKNGPYTDDAPPNPIGFYGLTKLRAETAVWRHSANHLVVRTMVIFGNGVNLRPDFITWVKTSLSAGKEITVVTDQIGNITLASNLAYNIRALLQNKVSGTVSLSGADILSRFEIAVEAARFYGLEAGKIKPILTSALKQAAPRPLASGFILDRAKTISGIRLLTFKEQLKVYHDEQKSDNRTAHV